jgi:intracellular proteinase inhibitor BsuPI
MNTRLVIPILVLGALAFACAPRTRTESLSASTPTTLMTIQPVETPHREAHDIKLTSRFGVQVVPRGVKFSFRVTNTGKKRVELQFPSGQAYEFVVQDSIGREVWRWTTGRMFTQALQNKLLDGGETMSIDEVWDHALKSGRYTAIATLNSSNFPIEERTEFVIR